MYQDSYLQAKRAAVGGDCCRASVAEEKLNHIRKTMEMGNSIQVPSQLTNNVVSPPMAIVSWPTELVLVGTYP